MVQHVLPGNLPSNRHPAAWGRGAHGSHGTRAPPAEWSRSIAMEIAITFIYIRCHLMEMFRFFPHFGGWFFRDFAFVLHSPCRCTSKSRCCPSLGKTWRPGSSPPWWRHEKRHHLKRQKSLDWFVGENLNRKPWLKYHQIDRAFRLKFSHHPILWKKMKSLTE